MGSPYSGSLYTAGYAVPASALRVTVAESFESYLSRFVEVGWRAIATGTRVVGRKL